MTGVLHGPDELPMPPRPPGLLNQDEQSLAEYSAARAKFEQQWHEYKESLSEQIDCTKPNTQAFIADEYRAALCGDTSIATALLLAIARRLQAGAALDEHECNFIAEALRRLTRSSVAVGIICESAKHRGKKERSGRPAATRKAVSVALFIAMYRRDHQCTLRAAIAEVQRKPWALKDARTIARYWKKHRELAERLAAENPPPSR